MLVVISYSWLNGIYSFIFVLFFFWMKLERNLLPPIDFPLALVTLERPPPGTDLVVLRVASLLFLKDIILKFIRKK